MQENELPPPGAPDIEIARAARMAPILQLAQDRLGIAPEALVPHGHFKAKVGLEYIAALKERPRGKLVLVTAITPTPAGEGKTTTSVGLNDGLNLIGVKSIVCLREPSLGPCFGMKGGAAGGGRAQVIDMNDRALRNINVGLGGVTHGVPRETGFDITVASEIMAILCLATDLADLTRRLGDIIVARTYDKKPVTARDLKADGAMAVLLRDAIQPNLVQSIEHNPAFIHGGPFANIAHGCNSVMATDTALRLADVVVTEAGFGADLGAEKFLDIKCRHSGLRPDAVVLVATVRALKMQGGVAKDALGTPDVTALERGSVNLARHIENLQKFGLTPVVAINHFIKDSLEEIDALKAVCARYGARVALARHWAEGGAGAEELARQVKAQLDEGSPDIKLLYPDDLPLADKIATVAREIYRADGISLSGSAASNLKEYEKLGYGKLPVCIAKTQYSFSTDPTKIGAATGHTLEVREVRLSAGAGFVVAVCGDIMTMPGLPKRPASNDIYLDEAGNIVGLA